MCINLNRVKIVKDLVLEKLDDTMSKLNGLEIRLNVLNRLEQGINHLVENESVIFRSLIHLTNLLDKIINDIKKEADFRQSLISKLEEHDAKRSQLHAEQFQSIVSKLERNNTEISRLHQSDLQKILITLETNDSKMSQLYESDLYKILTKLEANDEKTSQVYESDLQKILTILEENNPITIELSDREAGISSPEPDVLLMAFLYSFLPHRVALDVGANVGNVSEVLLESGYEVYAFEPYIPTFAKLTSRLNNHPDFHPIDCAVGADDGEIDLYIAADTSGQDFYQEPSLYNTLSPHSMPPGLEFTEKVSVTVRSLKSLQEDEKIPQEIGLLKIDAEGYDLEVIRGSANGSIPVVVTEFWDKNHVFAKFDAFNSLKVIAEEMRSKKYYWYIVVARKDKPNSPDFSYDVFYYCNFSGTLDNSWGNVFFFNDYELFKKALDWCSTMLPTAYFK